MKLIEIAEKLVGFNTVSQTLSTRRIADFISEYLEKTGFKVQQYPYVNESEKLEKVNIVATKGSNDIFGGRLALAGHMDTVKFKEEKWNEKTKPLNLTPIRGRSGPVYVGMGIADMKLFLAIAMKAGEDVSTRELKHPFSLIFTSDEEVGCLGARKLIRQNLKLPEFVVIGEPTEMIPVNLHKGYMFVLVEIGEEIEDEREQKHSSDPEKGTNSIYAGLRPILDKLEVFQQKLKKITDSRFKPYPIYPTLNVGVVTTGSEAAKNIIPNYCKIELDIRPIPGQDSEEILDILKSFITDGLPELNGLSVKVRFARKFTPPMETPSESLIVHVIEELTGEKAGSVCFNTEGGVYNANGAQTVICGPGSIKQAHKPNEFVEMKYVQNNIVEMYSELIKKICC